MALFPNSGLVIELVKTSFPILLSRLVQAATMVAGTLMLGRLGHQELAASALAGSLSIALFTFGSGALFSMGPLFSKARKAENQSEIVQIFYHGLFLGTIIGTIIMVVLLNVQPFLLAVGQDSALARLTQSYFDSLAPGVIPMLWVAAIQQLFIGLGQPGLVLFYSLIRLPLSIAFAYLLIFGGFGLPALAMPGLGWSISILSALSFLLLLVYLIFSRRFATLQLFRTLPKLELKPFMQIFRLGLPIGIQYSGEIAAYTVATLFMGWVGQSALVAQKIASQYILMTMMIPFALAQAVSVVVAGHLEGKNYRIAQKVGAAGVTLVVVCMLMFSLLFLAFPSYLVQPFLKSGENAVGVVRIATLLLAVAAFSQIMDAVRNVIGGALRAYGNTRNPMLVSIASFWLLGLPLGYILAFPLQFGAVGIPVGMAISIFISTVIVQRIYVRELKRAVNNYLDRT